MFENARLFSCVCCGFPLAVPGSKAIFPEVWKTSSVFYDGHLKIYTDQLSPMKTERDNYDPALHCPVCTCQAFDELKSQKPFDGGDSIPGIEG